MKRVVYTDKIGRKFVTELPDNIPDSEAAKGVPVGPPDLSELGLPEHFEVKLNNALFAAGAIEAKDVQNGDRVFAALVAALKADANRIKSLY